jgi:putative ABC transport system permease protein
MNAFWNDLRYSLRTLRKNPGFTAVVILTLALGIGANATIFSVINAVFLKPLPFPDPDHLVMVWQHDTRDPDDHNIVSFPNYQDWKQQNHVFQDMAIFDSAGKSYSLSGERNPEQVSGLRVTASFFPVLGIQPLLGRTFLPEEEIAGRDREVVLSYGLWQRRYGGDPAIIGKAVRIDGDNYAVVGVMPREFQFQFWSGLRELWVPAGYTKGDHDRASNSFVSIARLKPGVKMAQAEAEMEIIGKSLSEQYPVDDADKTAIVTHMDDLNQDDRWRTLRTLLAAVGFVLLIACVNVANLMLSRSAARQKELAIRRALGAGGKRIARQLLTESVLLGLLGGAAGLLLAFWLTRLLPTILPASMLRTPFRHIDSFSLDGRVFAFALLISCVTGMLFGLAPALSGIGRDFNLTLKEGSRGSTEGGGNRLRHVLVASEVALALVVLAGAGLMMESMARLLGVDPGLDPKNVLVMGTPTPQVDLYNGPPVNARFCQQLQESVGALPGIVSVGAVSHLPLSGANAGRGFVVEGRPIPKPEDQPGANYAVACPGYFRTMGIPLVRGREFTDLDSLGAPGVIVINEAMANEYWPNENPIGRRIRFGSLGSDAPMLTVVGVIRDVRHSGLDRKVQPEFYRPYTQSAWPVMTIVVRTATAPLAFSNAVQAALLRMDPDRAISRIRTMEDVVSGSVGSRRFPMILLGVFSVLALVLASVGIAGVVSYSVAQRTHEIGIRMALGARPGDVLRLIVGQSGAWVLAGLGIGIVGAISVTRTLSGLLYDVKPADPLVLCAVSLLLAAVGFAACYFPARRAMDVDPMVALRHE